MAGFSKVYCVGHAQTHDGINNIAFYPDFFKGCPAFAAVARQLYKASRLDFDLGRKGIPAGWDHLRREARAKFCDLVIFSGSLRPHATTKKNTPEFHFAPAGLTH